MTDAPGGEASDPAEHAPGGRPRIAVVSVSIDLGAGRRGVDMGPSAIRIAGLTAMLEELGRDVREVGTITAEGPETTRVGPRRAKFLPEIREVCRRTATLVGRALDDGCFPLVLGGDHSLSIGSVSAVASHGRGRGGAVGLIWVDAHTDMNTPDTTPSGNVHGMSLAVLTGQAPSDLVEMDGAFLPALDPTRVCVLGARSIDPEERIVVRESGVRVMTMTEVDERGIAACMDEAIERVSDGTGGFHLSFDLDALDPLVAPGVGTPVPGGLTFREAHLVCEKAFRTGALVGFEMVELNPVLDAENRTGRLAVGLVASALGKTIL